ncbi:tetratricopeptide repeat protein [Sessilibacter corallicola]|uniref:tetratricopeptide repeat protein n=1 Tax=Sessilibacter corallicola TaxID=2904075 RepID=UPI001E365D60|nr:tetratricopeptide repeat protein [Sessilibacter corallicola]MCE2027979.1 tetratricopeptide repeat protein [Sessilibacter corallicola]
MKFFKPVFVAIILPLVALGGCSSQFPINIGKASGTTSENAQQSETQAKTDQTNQEGTQELVSGENADGELAALEPLPPQNPYLANPKSVPENIALLFEQAKQLHIAKDWPAAELAWQEITVSAPELSGPHLNLGLVYEATDRFELAETAYSAAISANSLNLDAYNQLAILKRKQGEFEQAETQYLNALSIWPDHAKSHLNIAILYDLYMGRLEPALAHYEQYQALAEAPEKRVVGWISDLRRRIDSLAQSSAGN